jgi:tetratricopeptide (TPR) repeat protein
MRSFGSTLVACAAFLSACSSGPTPLYERLGASTRLVSTLSPDAQRYFDQGLLLAWGFQHDEAVRSFEEATRQDPRCAMAWWGIAYALGPNINLPLIVEQAARRAFKIAQKARSLADTASEVERALIQALAERYADPPPKDRKPLDEAYAAAMRKVWQRFPADPDVGTLFADALMNVSLDWRAWGSDEERGPRTPEIVAVLEQVLAAHPDHIGANHFYIHAVEASDHPERALVAAERLERLAPAAGHLVHMPAHIYIRLGLYDRAVATNERAAAADDAFFARSPQQTTYHAYRAHNHHFLA